MSFACPNSRRRARSRGLVCAVVAVTLAFAGISATHARPAAAEEPSATGTVVHTAASDEGPVPEFVIAPETPLVNASTSPLRFTALLRNTSDEPLPPATVSLSIEEEPLEGGATLAVSAAEGEDEPHTLRLASQQVGETAAQSEQEVQVEIDQMPSAWARTPGVYRVHAELVFEGEARKPADDPADEAGLDATTSVLWGSVQALPELPLTLVVPLVLPSSVQVLPTAAELDAAAPRLLDLLDAAESRGATIAVDPRILAGIRVLGAGAPASGTELIERLERSPSTVFLLQFADADPAAQSALGFESLLQPLGFDYAMSGAEDEPQEDASGTTGRDGGPDEAGDEVVALEPVDTDTTNTDTTEPDGAAAEPEAPASPTEAPPGDEPDSEDGAEDGSDEDEDGSSAVERMLTLLGSVQAAWPAPGEADAATLGLLSDSGIDSLVLNSENVTKATSARAVLGEFEVLVSDAELDAAAAQVLGGDTGTERAAGFASVTGLLALAADRESAGLVLALDRAAIADAEDPLQLLAELDSLSWVTPAPAGEHPLGTATLQPGAVSDERVEMLQRTLEHSDSIDALAPLLTNPEHLAEYQRERLLNAFSTSLAASPETLEAAAAQIEARDRELLAGVEVVTTENTQLVGTSSLVPVTLNNVLPFDAKVALHVMATSAAISLSEHDFEVEVPAGGNATALVPVHSRVSSGESSLLLEVRSPDGEGYATSLQHLTLRTAIEAIMLTVLGIAAALLLGFGVWRSIKRRRSGTAGTGRIGVVADPRPTGNEPAAREPAGKE